MTNPVKVSIIVPLYNKTACVERALASIAGQTFRDYEAIVVDDGSTDDGPAKVARWRDGRFRLLRQANAGPGAARNRGVREARGELIAFLDADDEWLPDFLTASLQAFEHHGPKVAAVTSGYFEWPAQISREPMWRRRGLAPGIHRLTPSTSPILVIYMLAYMCPWSTVVRADVIRRLGGFFEQEHCLYGEDAYLFLKVLCNYAVAFNLAPLVRFHTECSQLSRNLGRARPVDPFFRYPEQIEASCPRELLGLLREVMAIRALRTACMLGYWGQWRQARALRTQFQTAHAWRFSAFFPAVVCSTPLGKWLGSGWRILGQIFSAKPGRDAAGVGRRSWQT
ncbi:MAG TPA: glycosyltransferase family A protein [Gemmatimonadaceae bacterium]|nr:glycosyltransferase family A protein [Gemmatimonadaceae bacterium]